MQIKIGSRWRVRGSSAPNTVWKLLSTINNVYELQCIKQDYCAFSPPLLGETMMVTVGWFQLKGIECND